MIGAPRAAFIERNHIRPGPISSKIAAAGHKAVRGHFQMTVFADVKSALKRLFERLDSVPQSAFFAVQLFSGRPREALSADPILGCGPRGEAAVNVWADPMASGRRLATTTTDRRVRVGREVCK
ncbi:hypothetical protein [Amorphus sp. 3PC139-8]|uniref:hypothetical protein n=1 Tax=Amorphus sp. 3PC139-8 TaxID=2735676 RepID=UPI00345DAAF7